MKQGIIFGLIVTTLSLVAIVFMFDRNSDLNLDLVVLKDGEEIYTSPSFKNKYTWIVGVEGETKILNDQEIIEFFEFDMKLDDLANVNNIDFDKIIAKIGKDAEFNMLHRENGEVVMYEANCPDKLCVREGVIRYANQLIVCAPHKLVVKLVGEGDLDA